MTLTLKGLEPVEQSDINPPFLASLVEFCQTSELYGFHITAGSDTWISNELLFDEDVPSNYKEAIAGPRGCYMDGSNG